MKNSFKHLMRTPVKAILLFFLTVGSTLLLTLSSLMISETEQRISALEGQFTTIGSVKQSGVYREHWVRHQECLGDIDYYGWVYDDTITADALNFEGAGYITPPENRPTYLAYLPNLNNSVGTAGYNFHVVVFSPLEDCSTFGPVQAEVIDVLRTRYGNIEYTGVGEQLEQGDIIQVCRCDSKMKKHSTLEVGKQYIAALNAQPCSLHSTSDFPFEYNVRRAPYANQYDSHGAEIPSDYFIKSEWTGSLTPPDWFDTSSWYVEEITDDFWDEGNHGQAWIEWAEFQNEKPHLFCVKPTSGLQMIPLFQEHRAQVTEGREISEEEFADGAQVAMISQNMASKNLLMVGDKITLPLQYAIYGCQDGDYMDMNYDFSPFSAKGEKYEPFWEAEYEIVGIFRPDNPDSVYGKGELPADMFLIPANSVKASDESNIARYDPMYPYDVTFQIPNGTIQEFDAALHAAVPEAVNLEITYNDNGYSKIMESLNSAKLTAILLFLVSILATLAILAMLLYFFIVKEKKRTAIERSLGMTKRQCRVSLLASILALALVASLLGGIGAGAVYQAADLVPGDSTTVTETAETGLTVFSTEYSAWKEDTTPKVEMTEPVIPFFLCVFIPLSIVLLVLIFSLWLIQRNLSIEPIYLLSGKVG